MFYKRLELVCKRKGTTPTGLAKSLGLSTSRQNTWKKSGAPKGDELAKIADLLNVSTDYLLERTENPQAHVKSTETNNELVALIKQLTLEQQEMISLQIKGLLTAKKDPPPKGDG